MRKLIDDYEVLRQKYLSDVSDEGTRLVYEMFFMAGANAVFDALTDLGPAALSPEQKKERVRRLRREITKFNAILAGI